MSALERAEAVLEADALLAARVAANDEAARSGLVLRLGGRIRRVTRAVLRSEADAEDAAQLALVAVLESAASYRARGPIERWADRIAVRSALRVAREAAPFEELDPEEIASTDPLPDAALYRSEARPVTDYLSALPEPLRAVLVLRHVLDHSIEEIAECLSISPNTVKDRLLRARERMRRLVRRDRAIGAPRRAS